MLTERFEAVAMANVNWLIPLVLSVRADFGHHRHINFMQDKRAQAEIRKGFRLGHSQTSDILRAAAMANVNWLMLLVL
jgi:hypothetical protein